MDIDLFESLVIALMVAAGCFVALMAIVWTRWNFWIAPVFGCAPWYDFARPASAAALILLAAMGVMTIVAVMATAAQAGKR